MPNRKFKLQLYSLLLIFLLPIFAGWFLYHYHESFQFKLMNHGNLVTPPISIKNIWKADQSQTTWQIVYIPSVCCDKQCEKIMFDLHQLQKALGKNSDRVHLVLAVEQNCVLKQPDDFSQLLFTEQQQKALQEIFAQEVQAGFVISDKIYLIDPVGNLFMYYPSSTNPMNILKDLNHLLEVSQIG